MALPKMIYRLRTNAKLSQEKFAEALGVSHQAVQKWENGATAPDLKNLIKMAKLFQITLDALVLESDGRMVEEMKFHKEIQPKFTNRGWWELYSSELLTEYQQSFEEGLDIERYQGLFTEVSKMEPSEQKEKMADVLFDLILNAETREGYPYQEPSTLEEIKALRKEHPIAGTVSVDDTLKDKIHGAWLGRICGCLLGKPVESMRTNELIPLLKETNNYPMTRYIRAAELTDELCDRYTFRLKGKCWGDAVSYMPTDDDTNYMVLSYEVIEKYGRDFTPYDMSRAWLYFQRKDAYCTAERVAYCNFIKGYEPPESAVYQNPYREWIGAQIRGDYFGYINPGDPETAADMAFRDACISHVKNGIYGEMFASAMIACAALTTNMEDIIRGGLAQIPSTSRLYASVMEIIEKWKNGETYEDCIRLVNECYDEYTAHGWCHTISNAMIVAAALLYGNNDYGKSICLAVQVGYDTDCNGATVGSVIGMAHGTACIGEEWSAPINDTLETTIFGVGFVKISEYAEKTLAHLAK